jgi:hypothetical protein
MFLYLVNLSGNRWLIENVNLLFNTMNHNATSDTVTYITE